MNPLVSVITPVFNAEIFLPRLFLCVQSQGVDLEHIVIDDCSTDSSLMLIKKFSDLYKNIVFLKMDKNLGPMAARNAGLNIARGRFIAFLDADDLWLPNKILVQTEFMRRQEVVISFTDYRFISCDGTLVGRLVRGPDIVNRAMHFRTRSSLGCLTVMIDRSKIPGFRFFSPDVNVDRAEDFWAWAEVLKGVDAYRVPIDLARYTVVPGSRSSNPFYKALVIWRIYKDVEKLNKSELIFYFFCFCFSATFKRLFCKPKYKTSVIDSDLGRHWLDCIKKIRI